MLITQTLFCEMLKCQCSCQIGNSSLSRDWKITNKNIVTESRLFRSPNGFVPRQTSLDISWCLNKHSRL